MKIKTATFVKSCAEIGQCPNGELHEYAFIGRSNVGKSSLINNLTNIKGLAMISSKPGKTLLINYFLVNEEWNLVDLPGYGYAKVNKDTRKNIEILIKNYIMQREQLINLFVLIDSRLEPQKIDLEFVSWLGKISIPFSIVFTKADKLTKNGLKLNIENYKTKLLENWETLPPIFISSAETGLGKDEILDYIEHINASF
ncbi:MAG: YihA family ribosome biogenesis GTP-binding protein [Bacteroidia bacterium]|nr:YihA family ribosome biogenesis GTP-binding protein [Bacteroidia bacterium]